MTRYQKGQLFHTKRAYFLRFYQTQADGTRAQKCVRLCDFAGHTKGDARKLAAPILEEVNNGHRSFESDMKIAVFVASIFKPWYDANRKPSTASGYDRVWKCYLREKLAVYSLGDFKTSDGSRILTQFAAGGLGRSTCHHIRAFMSKMFAIAISKGIIARNPINRDCVMLASPAEPKPTIHYSLQQVQDMLGALDDLRAKAAIGMCYYGFMRPGEARGVKYSDWSGDTITIQRSVFQSKIGTTKTQKTRTVQIIDPLPAILTELRASQPLASPDCYILSGDIKPINLDSLARHVIKPKLKAAGIKFYSYYPARRGMSSLTTKVTNNPLIASAQMGNNPSIALKHYTEVDPETVRKGMQRVGSFASIKPGEIEQ